MIPTVGRPELARCLASVHEQLASDDLIYVMFDGEYRHMVETCEEALLFARDDWERIWFYASPDGVTHGLFGHPQRNRALELLPRDIDLVWSIDDDDIALPGALPAIRSAVAGPLPWFAFQMRFGPNSHAPGVVCWHEPKVQMGDIGTPCIVMPRSAKSRWGALGVDPRTGWNGGAGYFGDYQLARNLEAELGPPVWVPFVVCEVKP